MSNTGSIAGASGGIAVNTGGTIGTIANTGSSAVMTGSNSGAIIANGAIGQIVNSGTIGQAISTTAIGIFSGTIGSITNLATGTISAAGAALAAGLQLSGSGGTIVNAGQIGGGLAVGGDPGFGTLLALTNSGTITSSNGAVGALFVGSFSTLTTASNSGTLRDDATSASVVGINGTVGSFTNSGTIFSSGTTATAFQAGPFSDIGSVTNTATGTIQTTGSDSVGIKIGTNSFFGAGATVVVNNGLVDGMASGVSIASAGSLGTLSNLGTAAIVRASAANGIAVAVDGILGTIATSGTIQATQAGGTAIAVSGNGRLARIDVLAGGKVQGAGRAIDNAIGASGSFGSPSDFMTINNAGSIVGDVYQGVYADVLNISAGGTVDGTIVGQTGKGGSVNFALSAGNSYTMAVGGVSNVDTVSVQSGLLVTNPGSSIVGAQLVSIASTGTVRMTGTVSAASVVNNGIISIGTGSATVVGNVSIAPTGSLVTNVVNNANGRLIVNGNLTFNGGTIALNFVNYSTLSALTIASATNLTTTAAVSVISNAANPYEQNPTLAIVSNIATITFGAPNAAQLSSAFTSAAPAGGISDPSILASYAGLQSLVSSLGGNSAAGQQILPALLNLSPNQQLQLFKQLQPANLSSAAALLATGLFAGGGGGVPGGGGSGALVDSGQRFGMAAGDEAGRGASVWVRPYGEAFHQNAKEGASGFDARTYGLTAGADMLVRPDLRLGVTTGIGNTTITYNDSLAGNNATDLAWTFGVYGTWTSGNLFVDAQASFGLNWFHSKENLSAFGSTRSADFTGTQYNARVAVGYDAKFGAFTTTPSIAFDEMHLDIAPYSTSGGGVLDLRVSPQAIDTMQLKLGDKLTYETNAGGWTLKPQVHAYYVRNLNVQRYQTSASFLAGGSSFTSTSPARDADLANVGAGLTVLRNGALSFDAGYDFTTGASTKDHKFFLQAKAEF